MASIFEAEESITNRDLCDLQSKRRAYEQVFDVESKPWSVCRRKTLGLLTRERLEATRLSDSTQSDYPNHKLITSHGDADM